MLTVRSMRRVGVILAAMAVVAALAAPAVADKKAASEHFALAESAERRKDWHGAIDEYELAYAAAPHPSMLYNVARNYERLSEPRNAAEYYLRYLEEAGDAKDRPLVEERLRVLRGRKSVVAIIANPEGAAVFINEERIGVAPLELELESGSYEVYVGHQGKTSDEKTFVVEYGESQTLRFDLINKAGYLVIRSNVEGAEVVLDGDLIGRTPFSGPVPSGKHQLVVTRAGYVTAQREVTIPPNGSEQITANLSKDPDAPPEPTPTESPRFLFGASYGYDSVDEVVRYTLNGGIRSGSGRVEASGLLGLLGPEQFGFGVESRYFIKTSGVRPYLRAAAALLSSSAVDDRGKMVAVEGGVGIMFATVGPRQTIDYFLEIDLQGIVAGDLENDLGDLYRERYSVPISLGLVWSWGRR